MTGRETPDRASSMMASVDPGLRCRSIAELCAADPLRWYGLEIAGRPTCAREMEGIDESIRRWGGPLPQRP